jgi:hypothetical protein
MNAFCHGVAGYVAGSRGESRCAGKAKGLTVEVTQPFSQDEGPKEFEMGAEFVNAAFKLSAAEPFVGEPVLGYEEAYVVGLKARLPSENPPYESVRERVTEDYRFLEAMRAARKAGEEFHATLTNGMTAGKGFAASARKPNCNLCRLPLAEHQELRVEKHVNLQQFKQVTFTASMASSPSSYHAEGDSSRLFGKLRSTSKMNAALTTYRAWPPGKTAFTDWFRKADRGLPISCISAGSSNPRQPACRRSSPPPLAR